MRLKTTLHTMWMSWRRWMCLIWKTTRHFLSSLWQLVLCFKFVYNLKLADKVFSYILWIFIVQIYVSPQCLSYIYLLIPRSCIRKSLAIHSNSLSTLDSSSLDNTYMQSIASRLAAIFCVRGWPLRHWWRSGLHGTVDISWGLQVHLSSLISYPQLLVSAKNFIPFLLYFLADSNKIL